MENCHLQKPGSWQSATELYFGLKEIAQLWMEERLIVMVEYDKVSEFVTHSLFISFQVGNMNKK